MQTFQTAAVVGLIDNMSGPLKELANKAKLAAKHIEAMKVDPTGAAALAAQLNHATGAAERHLGVVRQIHEAWKSVGGIVAGIAASKAIHSSIDAIKKYAPLEGETRYQKAIGNYSDADMKLLDRQRATAAGKWGMSLLDTTKAQQVFTTRNFSAPITEAATNASIVLGRAMNVGAAEAGKMIEGSVFGQGIHLDDPSKARAETMKAADMAAIAAKKGAMTPEDIQQLNIYGMAPAHAAGLTPEQVYATGMTFKRANIDGTQAGTFLRAASSRLVAPTTMGRDALALMLQRQGKSLDDFTGGSSLSPEAIDAALRQNGRGRGLGAKGIASLRESMDDEEKNVVGDRASFNDASRKALEDSGQTFDKGEIPKIVAHMQRLRDISLKKINAGGLYENILQNASQGEMIKIFGDKQGGRAGSLNFPQYQDYLKAQQGSGGYAEKIAEERMQGFSAALGRLETSVDTFGNRLVQANEKWLAPLMSGAAKFIDGIANMSEGTKQIITLEAALLTLAGAAKGASAALGIIGGLKAVGSVAAGGAAAAEGGVAAAVAKNLVKGGAAAAGGLTAGGFMAAVGLMAGGVYGISQIPDGSGGRFKGGGRGRGASVGPRDYWDGIDLPQKSSFWHTDSGLNKKMLADTHAELLNSKVQTEYGSLEDSAKVKLGAAKEGDAKWGDSKKTSTQVEVTGTVSGSAELHNNVTITVQASQYLESLVKRAESVANMGINGHLGTSMQGPGDNGTKPVFPGGTSLGSH
jgi:hypothetical protein